MRIALFRRKVVWKALMVCFEETRKDITKAATTMKE